VKKVKGFSGIKKCSVGEVYFFRDGVAVVPGVLIFGRPVMISISEFKKLQEEVEDEDEAGKV
jgi:hypothetical protein